MPEVQEHSRRSYCYRRVYMCVSFQESFVKLSTIVREDSWMCCERSIGCEEWLRSAARDGFRTPQISRQGSGGGAKAAGELTLWHVRSAPGRNNVGALRNFFIDCDFSISNFCDREYQHPNSTVTTAQCCDKCK